MLGIIILIMFIGYNVLKYDANALILIRDQMEMLYSWHFWTTILVQVIMFLMSWILFIIYLKNDKNKKMEEFKREIWVHFMATGITSLFGSLALLMADSLVIRALQNKPATLSQISENLTLTIGLLYFVYMWLIISMWQKKTPKKPI